MFSGPLKRQTLPQLFRPFYGAGYATVTRVQPKGLHQILEKRPEDIVITFAKRTAMSRAKKGQLNDVPVDKLLHSLFRVRLWFTLSDRRLYYLLELDPQATLEETRLDPTKIDDICVGRAFRQSWRVVSEHPVHNRNLPSSVASVHFPRCSNCRRNSAPGSHLDCKPVMLLGFNGYSQYRTFHPERRG